MNRPAALRIGFLVLIIASTGVFQLHSAPGESSIRDVTFFLHRLRTTDHLPELEESHTALASTWDRSGGNADGTDFKQIEGHTNILLNVSGPGCVHRLFTGGSEPARDDLPGYLRVDGTRVQVFIDELHEPLFDYPVVDFFNPDKGPVPYPLAGDKAKGWTYPGCLFPIPYRRHCRIQLVNNEGRNWGSYWQIAYTTYPQSTRIESLAWPIKVSSKAEVDVVCKTWREFQAGPPATPAKWTREETKALAPGESLNLKLSGTGIIRELRLSVNPATPEVLQGLRLMMRWNGEQAPSVDVPAGSFFGTAYTGHAAPARFSSLVLGVTADEAYVRFPMPYDRGAIVTLRNNSRATITRLHASMMAEKLPALPSDWGLFHAQYDEARAALADGPEFQNNPAHTVLNRSGRGKYVGVLMRTDWPHDGWWGEGDWLIWSDEKQWPPSYHGTGSEEYFNCGWCKFDRKAISGFIAVHPGHPAEYSFHLNDAFQFRHNIRVAVETVGWDKADQQIREEHPVWATTAFWYEAPAKPSGKGVGMR